MILKTPPVKVDKLQILENENCPDGFWKVSEKDAEDLKSLVITIRHLLQTCKYTMIIIIGYVERKRWNG